MRREIFFSPVKDLRDRTLNRGVAFGYLRVLPMHLSSSSISGRKILCSIFIKFANVSVYRCYKTEDEKKGPQQGRSADSEKKTVRIFVCFLRHKAMSMPGRLHREYILNKSFPPSLTCIINFTGGRGLRHPHAALILDVKNYAKLSRFCRLGARNHV